jgi:formamidopyrimidine-DNA glycosylase
MPELPEVQAHAERLSQAFTGAVLERFSPISFSVLKTVDPSPTEAEGLALGGVGRRGKFLLLRFSTGDNTGDGADHSGITFVVHLMQGGRLVTDDKQTPRPRNGLARWRFGDGRALLLTEAGTERKAGVWLLRGDAYSQPPLAELAVDADEVDLDGLGRALRSRNQRLHGFLRDQRGVAGLGRMLANEICHSARLSPFSMTARLDDEEVVRLHDAVQERIGASLEHERTLEAMSKSADRPGSVHRRAGSPCPVCGDTIRAVEYAAYEVDYCPTCQTGGRVLADNTTSKFLK